MNRVEGVKMQISLEGPDGVQAIDIYSGEGFELLTQLWLKAAVQHKLTHAVKWLGIPIIQLSEDILMMQELIWDVKPDVIIETGIAHGGSMIFYASMLELLGGGEVHAVDIDIREHNRVIFERHPLYKNIHTYEGTSIDEGIVSDIRERTRNAERRLVVLDSNHSYDHVFREMKLYSDLVTPGSYLVVMDGLQKDMWDIPNGKKEWVHDNPLRGIHDFLNDHTGEWEVDPTYTRLGVTSNPSGFLRRVKRHQ